MLDEGTLSSYSNLYRDQYHPHGTFFGPVRYSRQTTNATWDWFKTFSRTPSTKFPMDARIQGEVVKINFFGHSRKRDWSIGIFRLQQILPFRRSLIWDSQAADSWAEEPRVAVWT